MELLNCKPDSPVYEAVAGDFEEILPEALQKLCPQAVLEFGRLTQEVEKEAVFCLESVGSTISEWTAELFEQGNYVKGMLADAIADVYLFQLDASIGEKVAEMCRGKQYGVTKRLEAPHDVPAGIAEAGMGSDKRGGRGWNKNERQLYVGSDKIQLSDLYRRERLIRSIIRR